MNVAALANVLLPVKSVAASAAIAAATAFGPSMYPAAVKLTEPAKS